jgi:hypothetical protein
VDEPHDQGSLGSDAAPLSSNSQALFESLSRREVRLGRLYLGGCLALQQVANPERIPIAAYSFRELMELMPRYLGLPVAAKPPGLKNLLTDLLPYWGRAKAERQDGSKSRDARAALDRRLRIFYETWRSGDMTRSETRLTTLRGIDPAGLPVPDVLENRRTAEWAELYDYFNDVLHHRIASTENDFQAYLNSLERLLLDFFRPRAFDDYAEIDAIIAEGR